jgi:4a-hydroxytetrahydrobiopterin dehydratase
VSLESGAGRLTSRWSASARPHREYEFGDFSEAFGFMARCALVAQKQDHHPEWSNVFNRVVVDLTTDDAGGISALDFALAKAMEKAASSGPGRRRA